MSSWVYSMYGGYVNVCLNRWLGKWDRWMHACIPELMEECMDILCTFQVLLLHLDHSMKLIRGHLFSMTLPVREKKPHFGIVLTVYLMSDKRVDLMQL